MVTARRKGAAFVHPTTKLGIAYAGGVEGSTVVPQVWNGNSMTCTFSVPEKSVLNDPDFCFIFTNYVEDVINGKVVQMPSADFYCALLKEYYKKQP